MASLHNVVSLESLPDHIHTEILVHLSQYDLCMLSLVNHYWYGLTIRKLYYHILILTNCFIPKHQYLNNKNFIEKAYKNLASGTIIINVSHINKLISTLTKNQNLINNIRMFGLHHWIDTEFDIDRLKFRLFDLVSSSENLKTFGGMFKFDDNDFVKFFMKDEIRYKLTTLYLTDLNQLFYPRFPANLTSLNMELNNLDNLVDPIDLSTPKWEWFYQIKELNINTKKDLGFLFLKKIKLNKSNEKLSLRSLSITHLHSTSNINLEDDHEIFTNIRRDNNYHSLSFKDVYDVIDMENLKNLNLKIDCHCDHNLQYGNDLTCFRKFFQDLDTHIKKMKLENLIIETFENSSMLGPRTFVSNYLDPLLNFIIKSENLQSLTLNFDNPGLQFYENIYTDDILKVINEAIFHFLKILKVPLKNLKCLVLPDFILSFAYFSKYTFLEGFLKHCQCEGCKKTIQNLERNLIDQSLENDGQEHKMVEILANIMGMLQFKRELYKPSRFTNDFNKYPIFSDCGNTLHTFYHESKSVIENMNENINVDDIAREFPNEFPNELLGDDLNRGFYFGRHDPADEIIRNIIQRQVAGMNVDDDDDDDNDDANEDANVNRDAGGAVPGVGQVYQNEHELAHMPEEEDLDEPATDKGKKSCKCEMGEQDRLVTTLVSHQSIPYVKKFIDIFPSLKYLMLNGVYYEILPISLEMNNDIDRVRLVYDEFEYPIEYI